MTTVRLHCLLLSCHPLIRLSWFAHRQRFAVQLFFIGLSNACFNYQIFVFISSFSNSSHQILVIRF